MESTTARGKRRAAAKPKKTTKGRKVAHKLGQAEEWQCAQAWTAWEAVHAGGTRDVSMEEFRAVTEQALARLD